MNEIISSKDMRVASLTGFVMRLTANEPKTPPNEEMLMLALTQGARYVDGKTAPAPPAPKLSTEAEVFEEVKIAVQGVFEAGDRKQLSPDGSPKMGVIRKEVPAATVEMRDKAVREIAQS